MEAGSRRGGKSPERARPRGAAVRPDVPGPEEVKDLDILVALKWIPDPELPDTLLSFADGRAGPRVPHTVGLFDKVGLEIALGLRESLPGTRVRCVSIGPKEANEALRLALTYLVDDARRIDLDCSFDTMMAARALEAHLRTMDLPDLILVGEQSGDWDQGIFGPALAALLGFPFLPRLLSIASQADGQVRIEHVIDDHREETVLAPLPLVASVTLIPNLKLRQPKLKDMIAAKRREVLVEAGDAAPSLALERLEKAERPVTHCEFLEGTLEEQVARAAEILAEWRST